MRAARPALVLVPGLICTGELWRAQAAALADLAEVIITDAHTRHEDIARTAEAVLAEAPARFALAGLSFGGYVALEIMRQAAERVERLALLNTSARADTPATRRRRQGLIEQIGVGRFLGVTDRLLPTLVHADQLENPDVTEVIKRMAGEVGRDGYRRQQRAILSRRDARDVLRRVRCPMLILAGRDDALTPLSHHQEMAALVPHAELVVLDDCGHLSPLERPDRVTAALRAWLAG